LSPKPFARESPRRSHGDEFPPVRQKRPTIGAKETYYRGKRGHKETTFDSFQGGQGFRDKPHTLYPEDAEVQTSTRRWRRPHVARRPLMILKEVEA
jgi:hypothetical protein